MTEYPELVTELAEAEANVGRLLHAVKKLLAKQFVGEFASDGIR